MFFELAHSSTGTGPSERRTHNLKAQHSITNRCLHELRECRWPGEGGKEVPIGSTSAPVQSIGCADRLGSAGVSGTASGSSCLYSHIPLEPLLFNRELLYDHKNPEEKFQTLYALIFRDFWIFVKFHQNTYAFH